MPDNNKTEEFLQKLAPCIERGEPEKYVEWGGAAGAGDESMEKLMIYP